MQYWFLKSEPDVWSIDLQKKQEHDYNLLVCGSIAYNSNISKLMILRQFFILKSKILYSLLSVDPSKSNFIGFV